MKYSGKMSIVLDYHNNLFESSREGMIIADTESDEIIDIYPRLTQITEISKEEIIKKDPCAFSFSTKINLKHKIYSGIFPKEYSNYKGLPLRTLYCRPLQNYLTTDSYLTSSNLLKVKNELPGKNKGKASPRVVGAKAKI